jgi:hypothetical protein
LPVPAFDTLTAPLASWRVGAQSLLLEELLLVLVVDSLLDEDDEDSDFDEELSDDEDDDELFSPASFVSRARFFVP